MTDKYAVIGNPIAHSKSPQIHQAFAKQFQHDLSYTAELVAENQLIPSLQAFQQQGFKGLNVTVPFKEDVWQYLENKSERAQLAGAVNTIIFNDDGTVSGDNTDGLGLCQDLTFNHGIELTNKRILLLGAGGAARGVIQPLLSYQPSQLIVANRTVSKAQALADLFNDYGNIEASSYQAISGSFDLIINATSASLTGDVPPIPTSSVNADTDCYDMMYAKQDTAFITWAKTQGAKQTIDGLGMLVEQAAAAFTLWRQVKPETQSVIRLLSQ